MTKQALLDQIAADIATSNICPDLAETATHLVMGDGNLNADIVFIGEAPGKNEDEQGLPFVGAAGKFLNDLLATVRLARSDVYITNIVKYRPPNNRDPRSDEKQAFWPYLVRQLDVIEPKLIVTLGRHSMASFLPDARIGAVHGHVERVTVPLPLSADNEGRTVSWVIMPLYHPAAALYNGGLRQTLIDDFQQLPTIIEQLKTKE